MAPKITMNLVDNLYPNVIEALSKKENYNRFKDDIDKYLAENIQKLNTLGPIRRVAFPQSNMDRIVECVGLSKKQIDVVTKEVKKDHFKSQSSFAIALNPYYISVALATRYFILSMDQNMKIRNMKGVREDEDQIKRCMYYMAIPFYAVLQKKYFKNSDAQESIMSYAISNMIEKNRIKQTGNMLDTIYITTEACYQFYKDKLRVGDDFNMTQYIAGIRTRLNSIMRKISNAYYEAYKKGDYIVAEKEDMDVGHQADSNSQYIERTANKVMQRLVTNGPDMKLIELAAKNNSVSVSELRNCIMTLCTEKQMNDVRDLIESLLVLFFNSESTKNYTIRDIYTDKFLLFGFQVYKKSNTNDPQVIKIKNILDKWLNDLNIYERSGTKSTLNGYRRAIFMFIVMTIIASD